MEGLKLIPYIALVIAISGIILGASVITLDKFGDSVTTCADVSGFSYNATTDHCACDDVTACALNSSYLGVENQRNFSSEYYTVWNSISAESDIAEQLPTVAIIGVMVIIISVIAGVFVYMRYFG